MPPSSPVRAALLLVAPLAALGACAASTAAPVAVASTASPRELAAARRAIAAVLDDWHDAASRADEARYFAHFAPDGVFLGTDATERWDVSAFRAYAHPHFARGRAWSFRAVRRAIAVDAAARLAWFDEDLATAGLGPARGSGVVRRGDDGAWRIAQYNLAITVPNERFAEVRRVLAAPPPDDAAAPGASDAGSDARQ